ncbi:hypothetical protein CHELA1G2_21904 [Hyphomicrobiales bacterium]|nr:hypothetical protein CHELA1G2_21904 [Hyphomicrobiales bacterium]
MIPDSRKPIGSTRLVHPEGPNSATPKFSTASGMTSRFLP